MVLGVMKWDIHPDKVDAYANWTGSAIQRCLAAPGVVEFRAYRGMAGAQQVLTTWEFADLASWAAWRESDLVQQVLDELYTVGVSVVVEVWGPSPVVPAPIRPARVPSGDVWYHSGA
jgi:heme-degrading monooxygenase HmoA